MFLDFRLKAGDSWRLPGQRLTEGREPRAILGGVSALMFAKDGSEVLLTVQIEDASSGKFALLADPATTGPLDAGVYRAHIVFSDPGPVVSSSSIFSITVLRVD